MSAEDTYAKARRYNKMPPEPAYVPYGTYDVFGRTPEEIKPAHFIKACVHFVGLPKDEYWSAMRVWGTPDFVHPRATWSCLGEIDRIDTVIFGRGAFSTPKKFRNMAAHSNS